MVDKKDVKVIWATYVEGEERARQFPNESSAIGDAEWQARNTGRRVHLLKSVSYVDVTEPAPVMWVTIP